MMKINYEEAVATMTKGLLPYLKEADARHLAEIFAGNSADGIASHGMNRYARYIGDMKASRCNAAVTEAVKVSGYGCLERWDAKNGVGPLIAEQCANRAAELAREHGMGCVALANNSHWLRAGRYSLMLAEQGLMGMCFTNTSMNIVAHGAHEVSTGNNPITMALPGKDGPYMLDMALSQYAYGKLEIMAQEGKKLPEPCGYDTNGQPTTDPAEISKSGLMFPIAMWKGSALSIMIDLVCAMLSNGRTSREIGSPAMGEVGMSQVFIAFHPEALGNMDEVQERVAKTAAFLHALNTDDGKGVRIPGANLMTIRETNMREGVPVTEATWAKIQELAKEA